MSQPEDPLAALSAAARNRPVAKPRPAAKSQPTARPLAAKPQPHSIRTSRLPRRPQKSHAPVYFALAALALVIIAGIIITVVMLSSHDEPPTARNPRTPAPSADGPGALFRNVKAQDPSK